MTYYTYLSIRLFLGRNELRLDRVKCDDRVGPLRLGGGQELFETLLDTGPAGALRFIRLRPPRRRITRERRLPMRLKRTEYSRSLQRSPGGSAAIGAPRPCSRTIDSASAMSDSIRIVSWWAESAPGMD